MKTLNTLTSVLVIATVLFTNATVNANDGKYEQAMKKNIGTVYAAKTLDELQNVINNFERIGVAEKTKWEPHYYAAFGYIMMANIEKDNVKRDGFLDQSLKAINSAKAIAPDESEIIALEGFAAMIRVSVDPGTRGPQYAPMAMQLFGKALTLNSENPRALALMAQMQFGTAQFFGSSTNEACATLSKSLEKFETFKSPNALAPQWGKGMAESLKEKCK
jgi:hypothetical protein